MAPSDEASFALLRKQSLDMYAAEMCSIETIRAYGDRWERVSVETMHQETHALYGACLVAFMPPAWSEAASYRKYAVQNYDAAHVEDPSFPAPDFHNNYGIK